MHRNRVLQSDSRNHVLYPSNNLKVEKIDTRGAILIRQAIGSDATKTFKLMIQIKTETSYLLHKEGEGTRNEKSQQLLLEEMARTGKGAVFIALINGCAVGYIGISKFSAERRAHMASFATGVLAAYHGLGVGFRLLQAGEAWAQERGVRRIEITVVERNASATRLYKRSGYLVEGKRKKSFLYGSELCDELYMAKLLS